MNIAFVHNWPGDRNAELDLIGRMQQLLAREGHAAVIIDPFGNRLEASGESRAGAEPIDPSEYDFCLNLHYSNPQFLDCFSYVVNWNPESYLVRDPSTGSPTPHHEVIYLADCLASHDVVLSAGSPGTDQLVSALADRPNPGLIFPNLHLHTTCQWDSKVTPVSLDPFRVFYIGVNWERIVDSSRADQRHGGLLELLDATGRVDFYGVKTLCGVEPWEGFRHYRGELPFDNGRSIIRTANQCGVSLVLSSRQHRDSGLVSTRIFQACAARTVIISDDNPFIVEHFGEAVLTFEHTSDHTIACRRINALIDWIERNPEQAADKAEQAHLIFAERFSLDRELNYLLSHHHEYQARVNEQILPVDRSQTVDIVYNAESCEETELDRFIDNLNRQREVVVHGIVCCPESMIQPVSARLEACARFAYAVVPMAPEDRAIGAAVLQAMTEHAEGESFCIYQPATRWHRRHIAFLLRVLQSGSTLVSQTHIFIRNTVIKCHAYDRSLANLSIGGELLLLRPDHLADLRIDAFSPSAFLFHRKLLINNFERARSIRLFDHAAYFFLLLLNYVNDGALPDGTARITLSRERDDALFAIHDMDDASFHDRLQVDVTTLSVLFRQQPAGRELTGITLSRTAPLTGMAALTSEGGGLYAYMIKTLRMRPVLKKTMVAVYDITRFILRLPPYPPRRS